MLNKILETCKYVNANSSYVKINYSVINSYLKNITKSNFWLANNPFNILDFNISEIVTILLTYHTICFSFWGKPKWQITTEKETLDGSYALLYLVLKRYRANQNFQMSFMEFSNFLKGNTEIPLLKERYKELKILNKYLAQTNFYDEIKNFTNDKELFSYIINHFSYFQDTRIYQDKQIYFYKRAQLLTSDILHVREILEHQKFDYSHLIGCADYKIPQVMNSLGMLEYKEELQQIIAKSEEIPLNSPYEVEIRANTLIVIDYIYEKLKSQISRIEINDYIWLLGQNKSLITNLYHLTRTKDY